MTERLRQYSIGPDFYPPYRYAAREVRRAFRKYFRLTSDCGLTDTTQLPPFGDVLVNILESHVDVLIEADELSPIPLRDIDKFETLSQDQARKKFANPSENQNLATIYVTKYNEHNVPPDYFGNMIVYITGDSISDRKWACFEDTYICVSDRKSCAADISKMLERYVFSYMRNRTELLDCIVHTVDEEDYMEKIGRSLERRNKVESSMPVKVHGHVTFRGRKLSFEVNQLVLDSLDKGVDFEEHVKKAKTMRPRLKDAVSEISTMYKRSNVPKNEHPNTLGREKNFNEEVVKELTEKIPQVIGVGYRLDTLTVTLDSSVQGDSHSMEKIQSETRKVLQSRNIQENDVNFICSKREISKFARADTKVGSSILGVGRGTLGGFVWKGQFEDRKCCMISANHVLNDENNTEVYLISNRRETLIARTLPCRTDVGFVKPLDIAAAILDDQPIEEPGHLDSTNRNVDSKVYDYQNQAQAELLSGLKVHLWGANSQLGKGKITMPLYYRSAASANIQKLIGLEDLDSDETSDDDNNAEVERSRRFLAVKGDSGSLVCADTPDGLYIDVIGMLIGKEAGSDGPSGSPADVPGGASAAPGGTSSPLYLSFDLQSGLQHMQEKYQDVFKLCKTVNNH